MRFRNGAEFHCLCWRRDISLNTVLRSSESVIPRSPETSYKHFNNGNKLSVNITNDDSKINLLCSGILKRNSTFRSASKGLDHTLYACGLTLIVAEGSGCRWGRGGAVGIPHHDSCLGASCKLLLSIYTFIILTKLLSAYYPVT